jgi:hypothetical protein
MKKISMRVIVPCTMLLTLSCSSSRTYQYPFNDENKSIIKRVLEHGIIACMNCTLREDCPTVIEVRSSSDEYELRGNCALYHYEIFARSLENHQKIKIKVKCKTLVGHNESSEVLFLDEVGAALIPQNIKHVEDQLKGLRQQYLSNQEQSIR